MNAIRNFIEQLRLIAELLDSNQQKLETLMAKLQDFKDLLAAVDAETTRIANKIDELLDRLRNGGMTEEEEAEALTDLSNLSERLKTIGTDPSEPIPPQ